MGGGCEAARARVEVIVEGEGRIRDWCILLYVWYWGAGDW